MAPPGGMQQVHETDSARDTTSHQDLAAQSKADANIQHQQRTLNTPQIGSAGECKSYPKLDRHRAQVRASGMAGHYANLASSSMSYDMKDLQFKGWPLTDEEIMALNSGVVDRALDKYLDAVSRRDGCGQARYMRRLMFQLEQFEEVGHIRGAMYDLEVDRCACSRKGI